MLQNVIKLSLRAVKESIYSLTVILDDLYIQCCIGSELKKIREHGYLLGQAADNKELE
jgi:hypothetical protein